jgi:hypothetical protein
MNDMMRHYAMAITSLERVIADKEATVKMLIIKYNPAGMWEHGEELLEIERAVDEMKTQLRSKKKRLKEERMAEYSRAKGIGDEPQLF